MVITNVRHKEALEKAASAEAAVPYHFDEVNKRVLFTGSNGFEFKLALISGNVLVQEPVNRKNRVLFYREK